VDNGGQVVCLTPNTTSEISITDGGSVTIDCPGLNLAGSSGQVGLALIGAHQVVKIRNLTMSGVAGGSSAISWTGDGTLILENCVFENFNGTALVIQPTGLLNLVIKNSRISDNAASGVLIQPGSGGSVTATFDGVTLADNTGGGLKTDSANGPVTLDIYNSTVTNNSGVGVNARSGGSLNMVSIKNSVITKNSAQGVQANGANVGVMLGTTLLDSNASGATSVVSGGHMLTYGDNRIVGSAGSGFTGTASLQ
jgi:Right handed beta helix region